MIDNFGVTPTGVIIKQTSDILSQIEDALGVDFGAAFELLGQTPEGQLINRLAEQIADLWQFGEQVCACLYPDSASGPSLDQAESLVNVPRIPATASVINGAVISGISGTVVPTTVQASVQGNPASIFQLYKSVTIGAGGTVTATFVAVQQGPTAAAAGTLTQIVTGVSGMTGVTNPTAAQVGTYAETDPAYRARAATELNQPGTGTFSGLLQAVQKVLNVSQAWLFTNDTDNTVNGLLPHSNLLIVVGGADQDIYNAIFGAKIAGIGTNGLQTLAVTDSQGTTHNISFSRLQNVPIYVDVTIVPNTNTSAGPVFPGNGLSLIQAAIIAFGSDYTPGETVVLGAINAVAFNTPGVPGASVLEATTLISLSYPPEGSGNLAMTNDQLAQLLAGADGSSNIYVNVHE